MERSTIAIIGKIWLKKSKWGTFIFGFNILVFNLMRNLMGNLPIKILIFHSFFFFSCSLTWIDHDTIDQPVEEFGGKFIMV